MNTLEWFVIIFFVIFIIGVFFLYFNPSSVGQDSISITQAIFFSGGIIVFGIIFIIVDFTWDRETGQTP